MRMISLESPRDRIWHHKRMPLHNMSSLFSMHYSLSALRMTSLESPRDRIWHDQQMPLHNMSSLFFMQYSLSALSKVAKASELSKMPPMRYTLSAFSKDVFLDRTVTEVSCAELSTCWRMMRTTFFKSDTISVILPPGPLRAGSMRPCVAICDIMTFLPSLPSLPPPPSPCLPHLCLHCLHVRRRRQKAGYACV